MEEALRRAQQIDIPPLLQEEKAAILTGPGSKLAGLFRGFTILAERGWTLILAAIRQDEHGPSPARKFARENVDLYIESIYDAHFELAQIGKDLENGYMKLGGPDEFHGGPSRRPRSRRWRRSTPSRTCACTRTSRPCSAPELTPSRPQAGAAAMATPIDSVTSGRVAQWESARFTRERSQVRNPPRPSGL